MNLTELIAHLRELEKKATPGPWESGNDKTWGDGLWGPLNKPSMHLICKSDADLIAAIRNAYTIHETWYQKARALLEKWK